MQLRLVKTIFFKELRDILRDRRTLFVMIVLPILLYPLLLIGVMQITMIQLSKIAKKTSRVVIQGREYAGDLSALLDSLPGIQIEDTIGWPDRIRAGELEAALIISAGFADSVRSGQAPGLEVYYNSSKEVSQKALDKFSDVLQEYKDHVVAIRLADLAADTGLLKPFTIHEENLATDEQKQGDALGRFLGYLLIMMTIMGAFYPAVDLTAGEKERGTLETLLVSPASRADIVYGKFLAVVVIAMITAVLNLSSMGLTAFYAIDLIGRSVAQALPGLAISPLSLILSLVLIIPLAVLFAALCLAIATGARNYKEGQSLLTPVYSLMILPAMISMIPGTEMTHTLAIVPIVNISLLIKEYMMGSYLWIDTLLAFASTSALAAAALWWATDQFRQEAVLFRHAEDVRWSPFKKRGGPPQTFPSPGTALLVIAIEILALFFIGGSAAKWDVERNILISQLIVLSVPLMILRRGGYNQRRVLSAYLPKPAAWPAVIVTMCGAWIIAMGLASLQNLIMPFPADLLEKFQKFFDELNDMPISQALLLLAVVPGVFEEILCRGFILHSLKPRFGKTGAIVLSAIAFGLLHLDMYRLLATTFLGLVLGFVVVWTGSIFPAMLGHAMNNAFSFFVQRYQDKLSAISWLNVESSALIPWYIALVGAVLLIAGLTWLNRIGPDPTVHRDT
ncbi:MAG: ABC transporter permease subunit/CPBP intramembrane protease [Calditrichota bacterium]